MNKIFIFYLLLFSCISLQASEASTETFFNPEDTWEYRYVDTKYREYFDHFTTFYEVNPIEMKVVDQVSIDGKEYYRMSWTSKDKENNDFFYLREENGAYYTYILDENSSSDYCKIEPGEYLLYDFNMIEHCMIEVPYLAIHRGDGLHLWEAQTMGICMLIVRNKYVDESGRRVLDMECINETTPGATLPASVRVVEGIGPMQSGNIAMYMFTSPYIWDTKPAIEFSSLDNSRGEEMYVSDLDRMSGFCEERDYTWIYGVYDRYGEKTYRKMGFNYFYKSPYTQDVYRRFGTLGYSKSPEGEWQATDFNRYMVRYVDGEVCLLHNENSVICDDAFPTYESLIYDFVADDNSDLTVYTPYGEETRLISTGFTQVEGGEKLSYTFDGSDGVNCVEGIGITKGGILPCVNTDFRLPGAGDEDTYCGAVLVAVYDGDGNLIFKQDMPSGVDAVAGSTDGFTAPSDRIYDLQGRELRETVVGQPYIKGGKVFVAK